MNEKIQEYLSNSEVAFGSGQYETALELCEKVIGENQSISEAFTGAGKACLVLDKLNEAEGYFQKAVDIDSNIGERYFDLANIKFGLEKYSESLTNYAKAEQYGCDEAVRQKLYYQMGMLSYMAGDTKSALINFDKADSLGPVNEDTKEMLYKRLQIYIETEDFISAENYAVQLKLLAPDDFSSYQIYFQVLIAVGKYDQAEEILAEAERYSDLDSDILNKMDMCFNRAMIFAIKAESEPEKRAEHYQSALNVFDEFLSAEDIPPEAALDMLFSKAEILIKLEKYDEALKCIDLITAEEKFATESESTESESADSDEADSEEDDNQEASNINELTDKIDFIRLTCYLGKEDYGSSIGLAESLKGSNNNEYQYFATYAEAFITKKFADQDISRKKVAEEIYNNAIAFFKHKGFENPADIYAIVFRIRLYAENRKYAMAEDLIKLLPDALKSELNKYVSDCRTEAN